MLITDNVDRVGRVKKVSAAGAHDWALTATTVSREMILCFLFDTNSEDARMPSRCFDRGQ